MPRGIMPSIWRDATSGASLAKLQHSILFLVRHALLLLAAGLSAAGSGAPMDWRRTAYGMSAGAFGFGLFLIWIGRTLELERRWFIFRSIAETAKSMVWTYMMRALPYRAVGKGSDQLLVQGFGELRRDSKLVLPQTRDNGLESSEITAQMKRVRSRSVPRRFEYYLRHRLVDQLHWYERKARRAGWWSMTAFCVGAVLQLAALGLAIGQAVVGGFVLNPVPVVTTLAAIVVAWDETHKHEELRLAYSMAVQDLRGLNAIAQWVTTEAKLSEFVRDAETAISREHTTWRARRGIAGGKAVGALSPTSS